MKERCEAEEKHMKERREAEEKAQEQHMKKMREAEEMHHERIKAEQEADQKMHEDIRTMQINRWENIESKTEKYIASQNLSWKPSAEATQKDKELSDQRQKKHYSWRPPKFGTSHGGYTPQSS